MIESKPNRGSMTARGRRCFIAMPITTPPSKVAYYQNDADHFRHVLAHLFEPAIELAGLEPVPPVNQGSNVVHAEIIEKISESDLVLCDMSCLNPNVFFELGIRTALNKPACLVIDDVTKEREGVPFDTNIVSYLTYLGRPIWRQEQEIQRLAEHIRSTVEQSDTGNAIWKYFGLSAQFLPPPAKELTATSGDRLEYLTMELQAVRRQLDRVLEATSLKGPPETRERAAQKLDAAAQKLDAAADAVMLGATLNSNFATARLEDLGVLAKQLQNRIGRAATRAEEQELQDLLKAVTEAMERSGPRQGVPGA